MALKLLLHSIARKLGRGDHVRYHVINLLHSNSSTILINRGWVPLARMDADTRREGQVDHMTSGDA